MKPEKQPQAYILQVMISMYLPIYLVLKTGSVVEAKWYAVNAAGVDPNSEINASDYTYNRALLLFTSN